MSGATRSQVEAGPDAAAAAKSRHALAERGPRGSMTWNMQGGSSDMKPLYLRQMMKDEDLDVICLQECGDLFGWRENLKNEWYISYLEPWGDNIRCSLAILTRGHITRQHKIETTADSHRPIIGVQFLGRWFWCVHAPSGGNRQYVEQLLRILSREYGGVSWCLLGDFNVDLKKVAPVDSDNRDVVLVRSDHPTHQRGGELDCGYFSGFDADCAVHSMPISDHFAVKFVHK